jgi:hypothetical protein
MWTCAIFVTRGSRNSFKRSNLKSQVFFPVILWFRLLWPRSDIPWLLSEIETVAFLFHPGCKHRTSQQATCVQFCLSFLSFFFFFFWLHGVWIQGLTLSRQVLYRLNHFASPKTKSKTCYFPEKNFCIMIAKSTSPTLSCIPPYPIGIQLASPHIVWANSFN